MAQERSEGEAGAEAVARRAAARLGEEVDPRLPASTERLIAEGEGAGRLRSFDPALALGLAGFLLSVSQFGWTIYRDLKADREKVAERVRKDDARMQAGLGPLLARRIRLGIEAPADVSPDRRDRIVEVVVEEILRADDEGRGDGEAGWDRAVLR